MWHLHKNKIKKQQIKKIGGVQRGTPFYCNIIYTIYNKIRKMREETIGVIWGDKQLKHQRLS